MGGRVLALHINEVPIHVFVADAWAELEIVVEPNGSPPPLGAWVLATGYWDGEKLVASSYEWFPGRDPSGRSEHDRVAWTSRARALRVRSELTNLIRSYFREEGFTEVESPALVPCPGLDAHVHSLGHVDHAGRRDWLITSPELQLKRLLVGGMPRVFEIARCFRAEEQGTWHEPEFTLVEWYRAFAGVSHVLRDTEQLLFRAARYLKGIPKLVLRTSSETIREIDVTPPFERMTVREAFSRYAHVKDAVQLAERDPNRFYELMVSEVEPGLAAEHRPIFLTHYPLSQAALARPAPEDPSVAERFELYVGGLELCNGFGELTNGAEHRRRFEAERARRERMGEPVYPLDERFLQAIDDGMPPSAGNALGLDRLVALVAEVAGIALTQAFPKSDL